MTGAARSAGQKAKATQEAKARRSWEALNDRQRAYLEEACRQDRKAEERARSSWSYGERAGPASSWRWILYGNTLVNDAPLRLALLRRGLVDKGTGSTWASLADRRLLETRIGCVNTALGPTEVLYVRLTTKGRQAARAGLGGAAIEGRLPPGTLREWHWRALARAYAAGDEGVGSDSGYGSGYGGIGWKTWLRLRDYSNKPSGYRGLVEERPAARYRTGGQFSDWSSHRMFATEDGRRFYQERWEEYRGRYPEVEAPDPRKEP